MMGSPTSQRAQNTTSAHCARSPGSSEPAPPAASPASADGPAAATAPLLPPARAAAEAAEGAAFVGSRSAACGVNSHALLLALRLHSSLTASGSTRHQSLLVSCCSVTGEPSGQVRLRGPGCSCSAEVIGGHSSCSSGQSESCRVRPPRSVDTYTSHTF